MHNRVTSRGSELREMNDQYKLVSSKPLDADFFYEESCWVIYASGFKYDIIRRYWPAIRAAYHEFNVAAVSNLARDPDTNAMSICRASGFKNVTKAIWCIRNAQRTLELDSKILPDGLVGWFAQLSMMSPLEIVEFAPSIVGKLQFKGIGKTNIFHLLKNVGIDIFKPDIHVKRLLADMSLIPSLNPTTRQVYDAIQFLANATGMSIRELDTLLFYYGQAISDSASEWLTRKVVGINP